jgi:hypothetical protein
MFTGFTGRKRAAVFAMSGATAAAVAGIALAGPAGASPASPASAVAATTTGHVQIMTTSATSPTASVIAWTAGTATAGVDHMGSTVDTIVFPGGTWRVKHSAGTGPASFNPKTCLMLINQHGTYTILGGTGKYKGISGHGTYQLSIVAIGAKTKKGACSQTAPPVAFHQVVNASGPVTLP